MPSKATSCQGSLSMEDGLLRPHFEQKGPLLSCFKSPAPLKVSPYPGNALSWRRNTWPTVTASSLSATSLWLLGVRGKTWVLCLSWNPEVPYQLTSSCLGHSEVLSRSHCSATSPWPLASLTPHRQSCNQIQEDLETNLLIRQSESALMRDHRIGSHLPVSNEQQQ